MTSNNAESIKGVNMILSQKDAVTSAVMSVVTDYELGGETPLSQVITTEQKKQVRSIIVNGFKSGMIRFSSEAGNVSNPEYLNKYVSGLLDNWIRKNPQFNNGQSYSTKNPGSRSGSGDAQIKALKALLKTVNDADLQKEVQQAITDRLAQIKPEATVEIDVDALPEHLKHLVG